MGNLPRSAAVSRDRVAGGASALAVTGVVAATVIELARQTAPASFDRGLPPAVLALGAVAVTAIVTGAWLLRSPHPYAAAGLAVATVGFLVPMWAGVSWLSPSVRAAALATAPLATAGVALVALRWTPGPRWGSRELVAVYLLAGAAALVHLVGYDPFEDLGCMRTCVDTVPLAGEHLTTRLAQVLSGSLTIAASAVALAACRRARRSGVPVIVVVGVVGSTVLLAISAGVDITSGTSRAISDEFLVAIPAAAGLAVGAATFLAGMRVRGVRVAVERLLGELSATSPAGPEGPLVAGVRFAVPAGSGWVDKAGRAADPPPDGSVFLSDASGPVLGFATDRPQDLDGVLAGLTRASWLSLRNAQLAAVTRARVAEVQASRKRVCSASDAERLRIERDLHDGAQQRLVSAALHLSLARARLPKDGELLGRAEAALRDALADLRRLTRGLFPSVLTNEGLRAALEELVRDAEVPATLEIGAVDDVAADAAMAAYATVATALEYASRQPVATAAHIQVESKGALVVAVSADHELGAPASVDYTAVDDRVGAAGGRLTVTNTNGTTTVRAEIPCAS